MSESSVPFNHPWPEDLIGNVGTVTVGGTPRTSVDKYWDGEVPWMASGDVHLKRITDVPGRITELGLRQSNATLVKPPAVAIGLAGQGKTRGTVALVLCNLCTNQSVALITTKPTRLATEYLRYDLEFRYEELRSRSAGDGRAGLSKQIIEQIPVPLPPPAEQSAITEILSTIDLAIEQTEALIIKQQRIKRGLMEDLLTRGIDEGGNLRSEQTHDFKDSPLGRIPREWNVHTLAECAERVVVGLASSTTHAYRDVGTPMVRNQNIRHGYFDDRDMLFLDPSFAASFPSKATRKGDVLTVRTGANVGDTAMVPEKYVGCPTFTTLITSTKKLMLLPAYLVWYVESQFGQSELNRIMVGGGKENLNVGQFVNFRVVVPPLKEQETALKYLEGINSQITVGRVALAKRRKLKAALMQDLLTGKKRVTELLEPPAQLMEQAS